MEILYIILWGILGGTIGTALTIFCTWVYLTWLDNYNNTKYPNG